MKSLFLRCCFNLSLCVTLLMSSAVYAQSQDLPILSDNDNMLLTVFLKHDQSMNNDQRKDVLRDAGFNDAFPPEGVEIVDHYVMMGIGHVYVLRFPPNMLRAVNRVIEHTAWGAYETEFYITYDLAQAKREQDAAKNK